MVLVTVMPLVIEAKRSVAKRGGKESKEKIFDELLSTLKDVDNKNIKTEDERFLNIGKHLVQKKSQDKKAATLQAVNLDRAKKPTPSSLDISLTNEPLKPLILDTQNDTTKPSDKAFQTTLSISSIETVLKDGAISPDRHSKLASSERFLNIGKHLVQKKSQDKKAATLQAVNLDRAKKPTPSSLDISLTNEPLKPLILDTQNDTTKPSDKAFQTTLSISSIETVLKDGAISPDRHSKLALLETTDLSAQGRINNAIATDRVRKSNTLKELVQNTESLNLNIAEIDLVAKEEKGAKIAQADRKSGTAFSALPPRTEHISAAAAAIVETMKRESGPKSALEREKREAVTLQTLLSNEKAAKDEIKKPAQKESTVVQKNDFTSLLAALRKSVEKSAAPKAKTVSQIEKTATEMPSSDPTADIQMQVSKDEAVVLNLHSAKNMEAEQLSRKIVDAKATLRHFAQTLQEQVENYKPPFTRMQLSLDPKELGSVEVTLINRGNNLHIQVNSNPTAIGIMATHGNELRSQLVSMGFTDVQMQFSMNQQQGGKQQQASQQEKYGETEEIPEFYESLELIVPQYV